MKAYKHRHSHIQRVCNDATISEGIVTMSMKIKNVYTLRPKNFPLVIFLWAVLAPYTCLDVYQPSNMCVDVCINIVWSSQTSICLLMRCVEMLVTQSWLFFFLFFFSPGSPIPWDSPGKNTGVGCHFLLQCMKVKNESEVAQSCPTQRPHGLQSTRLLHPWDFPGKSTGVGCHCLLCWLTLWDPMDCSLPGSTVAGIIQARILEWVAISFSRRSSWPRGQTRVSWVQADY